MNGFPWLTVAGALPLAGALVGTRIVQVLGPRRQLVLGPGLAAAGMLWLTMLKYLIRGVIAANRGEEFEVPSWICARFVAPVTR